MIGYKEGKAPSADDAACQIVRRIAVGRYSCSGTDPGADSRRRYGDTQLPRIDAIAARESKGALWLTLTKINPDWRVRVRLPGSSSQAAGEFLTGPAALAINMIAAPDTVRPKPYSASARNGDLELHLPRASATIVRISRARSCQHCPAAGCCNKCPCCGRASLTLRGPNDVTLGRDARRHQRLEGKRH